ncbi:hypothetical protein GCM10023317_11460 [Actinopolymorpha pittospori]
MADGTVGTTTATATPPSVTSPASDPPAPAGAEGARRHPPAGRSAGVDGLRAVAAGTVIAYHLHSELLPGGSIGVDVFFGISGFVITRLLLAEFDRTREISLRRFYVRRFLRLGPALMLLCAVVATLALATPLKAFEGQWLAALLAMTYAVNLIRAAQPGAYDHVMGSLPHTWSLGIEEQFYLLWPFALRGLLRRVAARTVVIVVAVLCLTPTAIRFALWDEHAAHRIYNGIDTRADELLIGCLLALLLWHLRENQAALDRIRTWAGRLVWPAAVLIGIAAWKMPITAWVDGWTPAWYTVGFLCVGLLTATVIAVLVLDEFHPLTLLLALPPLAWIGQRLSYGLYLWHYPILAYVGTLGLVPQVRVMLVVTGAVLMAGLSYRFVERPLQRRRQRSAPALAGSSA